MKLKTIFIIGKLQFSNALWLEYHSTESDNIYMTIVRDVEDIKKLQSLNLVVGSPESYNSYSEIIKIAKKTGLYVSKDKRDVVVKMRFCMCKEFTVIKNCEVDIIKV